MPGDDKLLTTIELTQPILAAPANHCFPPSLLAHCDRPGHVLVRIGGAAVGMDTLTAMRLLRDLRCAVDMSAGFPPPTEGQR